MASAAASQNDFKIQLCIYPEFSIYMAVDLLASLNKMPNKRLLFKDLNIVFYCILNFLTNTHYSGIFRDKTMVDKF